MPNQFNQGTVQQYGGVAWAKQQVDALLPTAIGDQINGYAEVTKSLNNIVDTLNKANASLQSAWDGDAATAATQTFSETSNHAQNVITTVNNTVTQLKNAQSAAYAAQQAMKSVPDEKPIPSGGFFSGITNTVSDIFTGTDPVQQAQQHNMAARNQAAEVLNKLSSSYETSANNMTAIAGTGPQDESFNPSSPASGSFNLGRGSYGGGSGTAAGYGFAGGASGGGGTTAREPSVSGVNNGVFEETTTAHLGPVTTTPSATPPGIEDISTTTTTTTPGPIFGNPGGGLPFPGEETTKPGGGSSAFGDGLGEEGKTTGGTSKVSSNVFGEDGFGNESGGAPRRTASSPGGALEGEEGSEAGRLGGSGVGAAEGEQQSGMRGMGGSRGAGSSSEEELGSSKYSRGRFFGGEEPGAGGEEWVQPSIGGNESLLVKDSGRGAGTGRVTSAYDGATDAEGNPLRMVRGAGRGGASRDEDDERGERPDYLKEDPEWWQSAQQVAPPVVE